MLYLLFYSPSTQFVHELEKAHKNHHKKGGTPTKEKEKKIEEITASKNTHTLLLNNSQETPSL
jgi:hypothetical protein